MKSRRRRRGGRPVHHVLVGDVGIGEDDLVDLLVVDEIAELLLGVDRDPVRIAPPGERRQVGPTGDAGDLGRGEGDDLDLGIVAVNDIEVVEVAASAPMITSRRIGRQAMASAAAKR